MSILDKIDKLKTEWDALQPLAPKDQKRLDEKFRLEFNYNSNHIEGNTLTYGETKLLLIFDDTRGGHTMREYEEMKAHDVAFKLIQEWAIDASDRPLTEKDIKNLNETILVRPFYKEAITHDGQNTRRLIKVGDYKEHPNSVRLANGEIFEYPSPQETPILMRELMDWYRTEQSNLHPVTFAAMLHHKFVSIHPFDDGNGRVSRLLMNYVLLQSGFPPVVIKSSEKEDYLRALRNADIGDLESFIDYVGKQLVWSLELGTKAANGGSVEESYDIEKEIHVWKKSLNLSDIDSDHTQHNFNVKQVYVKGVRSLFEKFIDKHSVFEDLFAEVLNLTSVNGKSTGRNKRLESFDEAIELIPTNMDAYDASLDPKRVKLISFKLDILISQPKEAKLGALARTNSLVVTFGQHEYYILESWKNKTITKSYDELIQDEEADQIVSDGLRYIFNIVKGSLES